MKFLDESPYASAYQFPYLGANNEWLFQVVRDGEICFSGRGGLGYAASRYLPFLRVLSFNRGPVANTQEDFLTGIEFIKRWAKSRFVARIELLPDIEFANNQGLIDVLAGFGWYSDASPRRFTLRMNIARDEQELLAAFPGPSRYKIRRAFREGIRTEFGNTDEQLHRFMAIYRQMAERKGLSSTSADFFDRIWKLRLDDPSRIALVMAVHQDCILGANLLFRTGKRVEYLFGAVLGTSEILHGDVTAGYPLQWGGILWAKSVGCEEYDFGGYDPSVGTGPAFMKGSFFKEPKPIELCPRLNFDLMPHVLHACDWMRSLMIKGMQHG
jgi:hypothetical protein